jgi:hypothetical protein
VAAKKLEIGNRNRVLDFGGKKSAIEIDTSRVRAEEIGKLNSPARPDAGPPATRHAEASDTISDIR